MTVRVEGSHPTVHLKPLVGTGLCGALTTFATLQVELLEMIGRGRYLLTGAYAATSILLGVLAVSLATALTRRVRPEA